MAAPADATLWRPPEEGESGWQYLSGPGRPPMSAVKQYAELFQEGWQIGRRAAEGYPYPDEPMDNPERVDQLKALRRIWVHAVLVTARVTRGWTPEGRLHLKVPEAVWLDGVLDGATNALLPDESRVAEIRTEQTRLPWRAMGTTEDARNFTVVVPYTVNTNSSDAGGAAPQRGEEAPESQVGKRKGRR